MKRFTAVILAVACAASLCGCGLAADEVIDAQGNVVKATQSSQALTTADSPDAPKPLPPQEFFGAGLNPVRASGNDPRALPQDPIPLIDPAHPGSGPVQR